MYCKNCDCLFNGWSHACPVCGEGLLPASDRPHDLQQANLEYVELVDRVRRAGGEIRFAATTHAVNLRSTIAIPYFGFGEGYEERVEGQQGEIWIDIRCTEVGRDHQVSFPWRGYGMAWASEMQGMLSGAPLTLHASRVRRMRRWGFPFFGYGYAWVEEMIGSCGDLLTIKLKQAEKHRFSRRRFPHRGFGYAWGKRFEAVLSSRQV